jgi:hypothetical protein
MLDTYTIRCFGLHVGLVDLNDNSMDMIISVSSTLVEGIIVPSPVVYSYNIKFDMAKFYYSMPREGSISFLRFLHLLSLLLLFLRFILQLVLYRPQLFRFLIKLLNAKIVTERLNVVPVFHVKLMIQSWI